MKADYQFMRQLYLENLTGTISEEDYALLQQRLKTDENARIVWSALEAEGEELDIDRVLQEVDLESNLDELKVKLGIKEFQFPWKSFAIAAMILVVIGFSWNQITDRSQHTVVPIIPKKPLVNGISLTTPDGEQISLSEAGSETITIGGVDIDNSNGILKFSDQNKTATLNELHVPAGKDYEIVLSDGSKVFLNSETRLKFPFHFEGDKREVFIDGEAYFEVKGNEKKPFIVHTRLVDIVVTGTRFNVNTYNKKAVRAALVEGKILLRTDNEKSMNLLPGFEVSTDNDKVFTTNRFDAEELLSWRTGLYYFHNQRLDELSSHIDRWYGVRVVFEREALKGYSVSGLMEKGRLEEFLKDLKTTSGIEHRLDNQILYFK